MKHVIGLLALLAVLAQWSPTCPATLSFVFVDNADRDFASRGWLDPNSLFQRNVRAAGHQWSVRIAADVAIPVVVVADRTALRAGGGGTNGRPVDTTVDSLRIYEPGALSLLLTGFDPGAPGARAGASLEVSVNAPFFDVFYWIDTSPETRTEPVPPGRVDVVSVIMHELGHGLGIRGSRSTVPGPTYGKFARDPINPNGWLSTFDSLSYFAGNGDATGPTGVPNDMFFDGPEAKMVYGGPVPLANVPVADLERVPTNFYHLGDCDDPAILMQDMMTGCFAQVRAEISELDLAIMADLGYPLNAVYYPPTSRLQFGISVINADQTTSVFGVRMKLVDTSKGLFELQGAGESRRASADATYNVGTGILTLPAVVAGSDTFHVELALVGTNPYRFAIGPVELRP